MSSLELNQYLTQLKQTLFQALQRKFPDAIANQDGIVLEKPPNLELGDFTYACFGLGKKLRKNPAQVASEIAQDFPQDQIISKVAATGPYLNIRLKQDTFIRIVCEAIFTAKNRFGSCDLGQNQKVMIEYSSPNTNKPLHIGHVRNNLIGMALANVLEFCGFTVIKANLVNDRGVHICKSMLAYQKWGNNATPQAAGIKGDHLVGDFYVKFDVALKAERVQYAAAKGVDLAKFHKDYEKSLREQIKACKDAVEKQKLQQELRQVDEAAERFEEEFLANSQLYQEALEMLRLWEQGDKQVRTLWKTMNGWVLEGFKETYDRLGCKFDKYYYESDTYMLGKAQAEAGLKQGVFYRKEDGSIWVSGDKLREAAPQQFEGATLKDKLLLRGDGTSVYITQDIGTAILKYQDFRLDHSIYVVADEQNLHFKTLFAILKLLGFAWADRCHHVAYGMVVLPHGMGKIKSREGTAVDADELMAEMIERVKEKIQAKLRVAPEDIEQTALDVALAALKVFMLQVSMEKSIQFDPTQTIEFTGDTGPAIQYSHARICSMIRKAASDHGVVLDQLSEIDYGLLNSPEEYAVIRQLCDFPDVIRATGQSYNLSLLANYLLSLTKNYAGLYNACRVLTAETEPLRNARLMLASAVAQVIKNGMSLLGVNVPESM